VLFDVMPGVESRVRYVDYIYERGTEVFELARKNELEGIVAKWVAARTSMANPQAGSRSRTRGIRKWKGDNELFETRRPRQKVRRSLRTSTFVLA
jgi:ATP-dependent DNA ligase